VVAGYKPEAIDVPAIRFPLDEHLDDVVAAERRALEQAAEAFEGAPHAIACFLAEPIQGEGGDNHMRGEFLQAMQALCREHDALFVLDEVQTGLGMTGTMWAYQQLGLEPDLVSFGKKTHVCGVMAGGRLAEVEENVFRTPSRINSTFGGGVVDMVRATIMLEVIERDGLVDRAAKRGEHLLGLLRDLEARHGVVSNARGRGLFCAIDLPDGPTRDAVTSRQFSDEHVIMLGCGSRSVRFRPTLTVTEDELDEGVAALDRVLATLA
jgi:L-lysine 6-transaminase